MFHFLRKLDHLPRGLENRLVALFLPELNIKFTPRERTLHEPGLPFGILSVVHARLLLHSTKASIFLVLGVAGFDLALVLFFQPIPKFQQPRQRFPVLLTIRSLFTADDVVNTANRK